MGCSWGIPLENTWNSRYGFSQYRNRLSNLFFSILKSNHLFFEKELETVLSNKENRSAIDLQKILRIPFFAYDKKFFIDQIVKYPHQYDFLKFYAIPFLFELEFPLYQSDYWEYISNLDMPDYQPIQLLELMTNEGIYYYASNLKYIEKILCRSSDWISKYYSKSKDSLGYKPNLHTYAHHYLIIISNTLKLMKESGPAYESGQLIEYCGKILSLGPVKDVFKEKGCLEVFNPSDMLAYILQYYYTQKEKFIVRFDYEEFKHHFAEEHKVLISKIVDILVVDNKDVLAHEIQKLNPILEATFSKDILAYIRSYNIFYSHIEKSTFEKYLITNR